MGIAKLAQRCCLQRETGWSWGWVVGRTCSVLDLVALDIHPYLISERLCNRAPLHQEGRDCGEAQAPTFLMRHGLQNLLGNPGGNGPSATGFGLGFRAWLSVADNLGHLCFAA